MSSIDSTPNENGCLGFFSSSTRSHPFPNDGDLEAFKNLSLEEQKQALEELHGVADDIVETPNMLERCLIELRKELRKIPSHRRKFWDRAVFLRPALEDDEKLMLLFLRGSRFNAKEAAGRLVLHYEHKAELFGTEKLPHPITLEDLDEEDMACLKRGSLYPLSQKDQAGRAVLVFRLSDLQFKHWRNQVRADFYILLVALEDEDTQRKGLVDIVVLSRLQGGGRGLELLRHANRFLAAFPARRVAFHLCYDEEKLRPLVTLVCSGLSDDSKARQRYHFGTPMECEYFLRGFGIKVGDWFSADENARSAIISEYIADRRRVEQERKLMTSRTDKVFGCPNSLDVLIGRGKPYQEHQGNLRFASMIAEFVREYTNAEDKTDKTVLTLVLVQRAKASGSRFLQRTPIGWVEVDDTVAREKVVNALRVRGKQMREDSMEFSRSSSKRTRS
eukprot:Nitzschia sp. Nitz4//scaffold9_size221794//8353//9762//NITZ4_001311-RA/size221794-snap-gene-0.117-mRNA-1//-1//CDS//3329560896//4505//frame0